MSKPRVRAHHFVCACVGPPGTDLVARSSTAEKRKGDEAMAAARVFSNNVTKLLRIKYFVAAGTVACVLFF